MTRRTLAALAERPEAPPAPPPSEAVTPPAASLVVVGGGMAAHRLCRDLVEREAIGRYRVTVCAEEPRPAYDRVHLTEYLGGRDAAGLSLAPRDWYDAHGIELRLDEPVVAIDRRARRVHTQSGAALAYDRLVLATGSAPRVPPIPGTDLPGVYVYRTVGDLERIRARARTASRAAVIGGGLLGLEAARALQQLGLETWIVEVAAALMPAQLDQRGSDRLARDIAALGLHVRTATRTRRIDEDGSRLRLQFDGGATLEADLVVIAAGVRPRSELAAACGLVRSADGGIVVDDRLQTSDPAIFAIGECVSHASRTYGLVAPGYAMAGVVAANLAGGSARFAPQDPPARLKLLGVHVSSVGAVLDGGPALVFDDDRRYRVVRLVRGRISAALGVGEWPEFGRIQEAFAHRSRIWPWQQRRFERTGTFWGAPPAAAVGAWPESALVCHCLGLTRGQLTAAAGRGCATVETLAGRTGASTVCGTCRPLLADLLGASGAAAPPPRIAWGLAGVSAAAAAAALAVLLLGPVTLAPTLSDGSAIEALWREGASRRASGFTLLGLCGLAALLTVRKRVPRLALGAFGSWRAVHAVIGLLTLAAMAAHTGLRLGNNLTMALAVSFLAVNAVGAIAGGVTGVQARLGRRAGPRWRSALVFAHIVALWPLPVLVAFHVLAVYYF